jgi:hypothetical protein
MSTIKSGTTSGQAIAVTGDTTGLLVFQTNGSTTALTLGVDQSATFAGNVTVTGTLTATGGLTGILPAVNGGTGLSSSGTTGNVLTSNGTTWVSQAPVSGAEPFVLFVNGGNTAPGDPQSALGII